jgi:Skp family chaperone for outer membrane proteins
LKKLATITILVLLLAAGALVPAAAADLQIAKVDMVKVGSEYERVPVANDELVALEAAHDAYLQELEKFLYMPQEAFKEATALLKQNDPLTVGQQTRLQELRALAAEKLGDYQGLRGNPERTAEENDEFQTLQDAFDANLASGQGQAQQLGALQRQKQSDMEEELWNEMMAAVETVAEEQGFEIVLSSGVVLLGGTDITDAVIAQVNLTYQCASEEESDTPAE